MIWGEMWRLARSLTPDTHWRTLQASWGISKLAFLVFHEHGSLVEDELCLIHLSVRLIV